MSKKLLVGPANFFFGHIFYRVKYYGLENLEGVDKCLLCPNHSNTFEPVWVYCKVPNTSIMAKAELFKNKLIAKLLRKYDVFPIQRGKKDAKSLIHAIKVVKDNDHSKLLIFPEGTRIKKDKERGKAKYGPAYIAAKAGVPIVPIYITKNAKFFSSPKVVFGKPIEVPSSVLEDKVELQAFSDKMLDTIYDLQKVGKEK